MLTAESPVKVLLVDDDEDAFVLTRDMLRDVSERGFELEWAASYEEALTRSASDAHDVFLLDYRLGRQTGLELLREMRDRGMRTPAIVITGQGNLEVDNEAIRIGAADYIDKNNLQGNVLERSIRHAIEHARILDDLQESEERFRRLAEATSEGIVVIEDGRITDANANISLMTGYDADELLGMPVLTLIAPEFLEQVTDRTVEGHEMPYEVSCLRKDGSIFPAEVCGRVIPICGRSLRVLAFRDLTEKQRGLAAMKLLGTAVEQAAESIIITDIAGTIQYVNPAFERITGYRAEEVLGQNPRILKSGQHPEEFYSAMWGTLQSGEVWCGRLVNRAKDGTLYEEDGTISPVRDDSGRIVNYVAVKRDVTQSVLMEGELRQAQKMEAVGSLAAGIAHEINTPIQFVGDNASFLRDAFEELMRLIDRAVEDLPTSSVGAPAASDLGVDLDFLRREIPRALEQTHEGVRRVAAIIRAMREFSHVDSAAMAPSDLNRALINTITITQNELKFIADIVTDLDPDLPLVVCDLSCLNQTFLNILINAGHAIEDVIGRHPEHKGTITVVTRREGEHVRISISDTGTGIPEEIRNRVFDPFFTTKPVGRGSGQGLAISHAAIVEKHHGSLTFETAVGKGTTFTVRIPIDPQGVQQGPGPVVEGRRSPIVAEPHQ
ncbi:MAG: PAS domain S-box protein [Candidatus Zixiibacteriota bacterium]